MNTNSSNSEHPRGLYLLFFTEMWGAIQLLRYACDFHFVYDKALFIDKKLLHRTFMEVLQDLFT